LEQQEYHLYPYEHVASNYDQEQSDIFPNLFQEPIVDNSMHESSSMSIGFDHDVPIFDKYNDKEEDFKFCEDFFTSRISFSYDIQQTNDQKCVHVVVNASYESVDQNCSEDQEYTSSFLSKIVSYNRTTYHHDEFKLHKYGKEEQKGVDQKLSLYFSLSEEEPFIFNIYISEGNQHHFNFKLKQYHDELFLCDIHDPFADFMKSMSNINIKIFLLNEG